MNEFDFDNDDGGIRGTSTKSSGYVCSTVPSSRKSHSVPNKRMKRYRLNNELSRLKRRDNFVDGDLPDDHQLLLVEHEDSLEFADDNQRGDMILSYDDNTVCSASTSVNSVNNANNDSAEKLPTSAKTSATVTSATSSTNEKRSRKRLRNFDSVSLGQNGDNRDNKEESIANSNSSASVSSTTSSNISATSAIIGNGVKRKKRHRLNGVIGSNTARFEDSTDNTVGASNGTTTEGLVASTDLADLDKKRNTNGGSKVNDIAKGEVKGSMKPPSIRSNTRLSRRRKRKLPATKTDDFSSSFDDFSGSSSFLSSYKSPETILGSRKEQGTRSLNEKKQCEGDDVLVVEPEIKMVTDGIHFGTPPGSPSIEVKNYNLMMMRTAQSLTNYKSSAPNSPAKKQSQPRDDESVSSRASRESNNIGRIINSSRIRSEHVGNAYDSRSPQSSQANSSIISYGSEKVFTGAGTDVYALQDAGSHRLLLDDCNYFCSSFLTGVGGVDNDVDDQGMKKHSAITAHAACDMAVMLSSKKNRGVVMSMGSTGGHGADMTQNSDTPADHDILQSILSIIGFVPTRLALGSYLPSSTMHNEDEKDICEDELVDWNEIISETGSLSSKRTDVISETSRFSSGRRRTKRARQNDLKPDESVSKESAYDTVVANALATSAYYLSMDCTTNKVRSASSTTTGATLFRRRMLRNKSTVCGISKLILADHVVATILESKNPKSSAEHVVSVPASNVTAAENEPMSEGGVDPTSRGRRRKRRKKVCTASLGCNAIYTIPEDQLLRGHNGSMSSRETEERKEETIKMSGFDFVSDEASSNANSHKSEGSRISSRAPLIPSRFKQKLDTAQTKLLDTKVVGKCMGEASFSCEYCAKFSRFHTKRHTNTGYLALEALNKIVIGKYDVDDDEIENAEDCVDDGIADDIVGSDDGDTANSGAVDDIESSHLTNPMIFKNVMIRQSGAIPYLARAMVETLEAANIMAARIDSQPEKFCVTCSEYISDRILSLSSLIDGLCLMSSENRQLFCRVAIKATQTSQPILIPALLKTFAHFSLSSLHASHGTFADIGLAALRTLTSLTHDNDVGSAQFIVNFTITVPGSPLKKMKGVEIIFRLLHIIVNRRTTSQHIYDSVILCLNSLTNILESSSFSDVCKTVLDIEVEKEGEETKLSALTWLSQFIVNQTQPFRDAVMSGQFGKENCANGKSGRDLELHEDEYLVTAGNGFILLSCFLGADIDGKTAEGGVMKRIKNTILAEIPENSEGGKLILVINTLKAFCNFYRYSIGDLSVAVIAPVLKLISGLEKLRQMQLQLITQ